MSIMEYYCLRSRFEIIRTSVVLIGASIFLFLCSFIVTDEDNGFASLVILSIFCFCVSIGYYLYEYNYKHNCFKEKMYNFRQRNMDIDINEDFLNAVPMFGDKIRVGNLCIYGKKTGKVLEYRDIDRIWRYEYRHIVQSPEGSTVRSSVSRSIKFQKGSEIHDLCQLNGEFNDEWKVFINYLSQRDGVIITVNDIDRSVDISVDMQAYSGGRPPAQDD